MSGLTATQFFRHPLRGLNAAAGFTTLQLKSAACDIVLISSAVSSSTRASANNSPLKYAPKVQGAAAQGNALGRGLKGVSAPPRALPFQGVCHSSIATQGDALGCFALPLRGEIGRRRGAMRQRNSGDATARVAEK